MGDVLFARRPMDFVNKLFMSVVQTENVFKDYQIEWQEIQALGRGSVR